MSTDKKINVVGYVRVSTPGQAEEGESIDTQKTQITEFVSRHPEWELIQIYADEGATATKIEYRFQFQKMIREVKERNVELIIFTKLSRFARNARDYQNLSFQLEKDGVRIVSIKENIDPTNKMGKFYGGLMALIAEWEHETIREQMSENKMIRWKDKRSFIGIPPFGYKWNKSEHKLDINRDQADLYLKIVNMYVHQGMALREIGNRLNEKGLLRTHFRPDGTLRKSMKWRSTTLSYILKNPCYYGHYVVNKKVYVDDWRGAGKRRTNKLKPASEHITFEIEPLITKLEWDEIQASSEKRKVVTKRTGEHTLSFFLRDVVYCGRCGGKMNSKIGSKRKDGSINRYYICYWSGSPKKYIEGDRGKCSLPHIIADKLEDIIWNEILMLFAFTDPKKISAGLYDPIKYDKEINSLIAIKLERESELTTIEGTRKRYYLLLKKEGCNIDEVNELLQQNAIEKITVSNQVEQIRQQLEILEKRKKEEKELREFIKTNKKQLDRLYRDITNLAPADKKLFVEGMLDGPITVDYQDFNPDYPEDGYGVTPVFKLKFNFEILKRFIDEGKVLRLSTNTTEYLYLINMFK